MKAKNKSQSSFCLNETVAGTVIKCQGSKRRSPILLNVSQQYEAFPVFESIPKQLVAEFPMPATYGSFNMPSNEAIESICSFFKNRLWIDNRRASHICEERRRKIKKQKAPEIPLYNKQIRLLFSTYYQSVYSIAQHLKMSRKTIKTILSKYKDLTFGDPELDATPVYRRRVQNKYSNEGDIVEYIKNMAIDPTFNRSSTVKDIIEALKQRFGYHMDFKKSKTYSLMAKAGLRYRRVKTDIQAKKDGIALNEAQKVHLLKLANAIYEKKLIVYIDETYVNNLLLPTKMWFLKTEEPRVQVKPKESRATIIAACTDFGFEQFQIIYDSIDSVHYCIFVLTLYERMRVKYNDREVLFVFDNARPHVSKLSSQVLNGLPFIRQSAYSPRMNLIEYAFGYFKKHYRTEQYVTKEKLSQKEMVHNSIVKVGRATFHQAKV